MKKIFALLLAAVLLTATACAHTDTGDQPGDTTAGESVSSSQPPQEPEETEYSVCGTILDGTMNSLSILSDSGVILNFSTVGADKSGCNGLLIDSRVTVYYTGEIDGDDTKRCRVTRLEQE